MGPDARTVPQPHRAGALEETKVALSGLPGAPEDDPGCAGVQAARRPPSLPSRLWPSPASPDPERAPPGSAVFPIKAGIPGWAETKRDRAAGKANQSLVDVRLWGQRCLLITQRRPNPHGPLQGKSEPK